MRKFLGRIFSDRRVVGFLLIAVQAVVMAFGISALSEYWQYTYYLFLLLSLCVVIWLVRKYDNPTYKISWIIIILCFPLFGGIFYMLWGNTPFNSAHSAHRYQPPAPHFENYLRTPASEELAAAYPRHAARTRYIRNLNDMPAWKNTECHFFGSGEAMYASMLKELAEAKKFVFLEYFIIEQGVMWDSILAILTEKVKQGVDVRIMYDDVGSIVTLPKHYDEVLQKLGIRAVRFNRFVPMLNTYLNYRNHRKLCVIDGNISYMGGINLADEYINVKKRFGYWKDSGVMLHGEGTANVTVLFLQLWEYVTNEKMPPLDTYLPTEKMPNDGYVQPFADSPLDDLNISEAVYLQMINTARDYVYITTPYLILDNEMITALVVAAQSGVDVRICVPGIPDKKLVYMVTRSYYQQLHRAGVKIYEYRPGFLHAKMLVSDDESCVVGTVNMDFRSFFLHFECATAFFECSVTKEVKQDIDAIIEKSRIIDDEWLKKVPWIHSIVASLLRLFAPML